MLNQQWKSPNIGLFCFYIIRFNYERRNDMKVFLSHPMHGLTEEQIMSIRYSAWNYLNNVYGNIELIDNYRHEDAPTNSGHLWHLGRSIQQLEEADAIYFCDVWENARGCLIERQVAEKYGLRILE